MAGDWIKIEHATIDKPEVVQMAAILGWDDHDLAFAKCVRLWTWADQQSVDGNALSVTDSFIDRYVFVTGFAHALREVGWLDGESGQLQIPNFDRHNGKTAKNRAKTNKRVAGHRETKRKCNDASVTKSVTREEKRREEKNTHTHTKGGNGSVTVEALHPYFQSAAFSEQWDNWVAYKQEKFFDRLSEIETEQQLMDLERCCQNAADAAQVIAFTIGRGARGLILNGDHRQADKPKQSRRRASVELDI